MTLQPPVESYGTPNALGLDDAYIGVPTWDIADGLISDKPSCTPPGQGRFTSRDSMFGEVSSPMSLNQFAYAAMNPVTMWDPTGLYPTCDGKCSGNTQENLIRNFSQNYGAAVQAGTGGSGYSPGTSAQTSAQPVQAITTSERRATSQCAPGAPGDAGTAAGPAHPHGLGRSRAPRMLERSMTFGATSASLFGVCVRLAVPLMGRSPWASDTAFARRQAGC